MKEQDPKGKDELTRQPNQPKLEGERTIFMSENGEGSGSGSENKDPESLDEKKDPKKEPPKKSNRPKKKTSPASSRRDKDLGSDDIAQQQEAAKGFTPSAEWQEVPEGTAIPPGAEIRMNMSTGKKEARWTEDDLSANGQKSSTEGGQDSSSKDSPDQPSSGASDKKDGEDKDDAPLTAEDSMEKIRIILERYDSGQKEADDKEEAEQAMRALSPEKQLQAEILRDHYNMNDPEVARMARGMANVGPGVHPKEVIGKIDSLMESASSFSEVIKRLRDSKSLFADQSVYENRVDEEDKGMKGAADLRILLELASKLKEPRFQDLMIDMTGLEDEKIHDQILDSLLAKIEKVKTAYDKLDAKEALTADQEQEALKDLKDLISGYSISFTEKGKPGNLTGGLLNVYKSAERFQGEALPQCLEDLTRMIMYTEVNAFKPGGQLELMDKKGNVNLVHLHSWFRSRYNYEHDLHSDSEIDLFSSIHISMLYRTITLGEMLSEARYFRKEEHEVLLDIDEKGEATTRQGEKSFRADKTYDIFRDHVMYSNWVPTIFHNDDVKYQKAMGQEKKLPEAIVDIMFYNVATKNVSERIGKMLRFSSTLGISDEEMFKTVQNDGEWAQGEVGQMIQTLLAAYSSLREVGALEEINFAKGDKNKFEKQLGKEGTLRFYKTIMQELKGIKDNDIDYVEKIKQLEEEFFSFKQEDYENALFELKYEVARLMYGKYFIPERFTDEEGKTTDDRDKVQEDENLLKKMSEEEQRKYKEKFIGKWVGQLNYFNLIKKQPSITKMVKRAMKDAAAEKVGVEELRGIKHNSILSVDRQFAANIAESMLYWLGISAMNDPDAIGHDFFAKLANAQAYRIGQVGRGKGGKGIYGDITTLYGLKRVGLTMLDGLNVMIEGKDGESEQVPFGKFLLGETGHEKEGVLLKHEFEGNAQRQYAMDHVMNATRVYNWLQREHGFGLDNILKRNPRTGRLVVDEKKADETMKEGLFKWLRYTFDLGQIKWDAKMRSMQYIEKRNENNVVEMIPWYSEETLDDVFFEKGIQDMKMYDGIDRKRQRARDVFSWLLSRDLFARRHWTNPEGREKIGTDTIESIITYFAHTYLTDYDRVSHRRGRKKIMPKRGFYTRDEMKRLLKKGNATLAPIYTQEIGGAFAAGSLGGVFKGLAKMFAYALKQ